MKPMTIFRETHFDNVPIVLYDHSVPLHLRAKKKIPFASGIAAANWLGINPKYFYKKRGYNVTSPKHLDDNGKPKTFAIRVASNEKIVKN